MIAFALLTAALLAQDALEQAPTREPAPLVVASWNLRFASLLPPHPWAQRRPAVRAQLEAIDPDVLGTQEGLFGQLRSIDADLPGHDWIGLGREGGSHGEFMAIFYRRQRLEPLEYDHYWLSLTPEVPGSSSWNSACPRMVSWVRFRDRADGHEFILMNTHLDHRSAAARREGAALIAERSRSMRPDLPLLLTGDFNAAARTSEPWRALVEECDFRDTWDLAAERGPLLGTFGGWAEPKEGGTRIDWILARGPLEVLRAEIPTLSMAGVWPSDHLPVVARVLLPTGG